MGLVTWIAIGVIVLVAIGLGAGVFFSGLLRGAQIVAQNPVVQNATQEVTKTAENTHITTTNTVTVVQSEKTVYRTNEPVVIVVKNTGSDKVVLANSEIELKLKNQNNGKTYDTTVTQVKQEVDPGDSVSVTWNQQDNSGNSVDPGSYVVDVQNSDQASIGQTTFTIQS